MKRILFSFTIFLSIIGAEINATSITARYTSDIRPDVALKLIETIDSIEHSEAEWSRSVLKEKIERTHVDSTLNFCSVHNYTLFSNYNELFIVINTLPQKAEFCPYDKIEKNGEYFTILSLGETSLSNRIYNDYLWPDNQLVRSYGFTKNWIIQSSSST